MVVSVTTVKVKPGKHREGRELAKEYTAYVNGNLSPEHPMQVSYGRFGKTNEAIFFIQNFEDLASLDSFQKKMWSGETPEGFRERAAELSEGHGSLEVYSVLS